jgi:hypothetical protein
MPAGATGEAAWLIIVLSGWPLALRLRSVARQAVAPGEHPELYFSGNWGTYSKSPATSGKIACARARDWLACIFLILFFSSQHEHYRTRPVLFAPAVFFE